MTRRCPLCEGRMEVVPGSDRTMRGKVFYSLRCPRCGHTELERTTVERWRHMGVQPW